MKMTFGTWMKDTALLNDERIWVAEHFSGGLGQKMKSFRDQIRILCTSATDSHEMVEYMMSDHKKTLFVFSAGRDEHYVCSSSGRVLKEYDSISAFETNSSQSVDVRKFYQGCGHTVHNGSFYYQIAGTSSIAR